MNAFSPSQVSMFCQTAAAASGVSMRGVDAELAWSLTGVRDPLEVAGMTMRRYAAKWWMASVPRPQLQRARDDALEPEVRINSFRAAQAAIPPPRPGRPAWFKWSKGPISDAIRRARAGGWTWKSPSVLAGRQGIDVDIAVSSPCFVAKRFVSQLKNAKVQAAARRVTERQPGPEAPALNERGLWWEIAARFSRSARELPPRAIAFFKQLFASAVPTAQNFRKWGYSVSPDCQYCGRPDTAFHRCWACPHGKAKRDEVCAPEMRNDALEAGELSYLFTRASLPHLMFAPCARLGPFLQECGREVRAIPVL